MKSILSLLMPPPPPPLPRHWTLDRHLAQWGSFMFSQIINIKISLSIETTKLEGL